MAKKSDSFRLGISVIVIFALFFAVVIYIGSGWDSERKVPFVAHFPHTLNLPLIQEGAEVMGFGQVIGSVTDLGPVDVTLPGDESGKTTLCLEIKGVVNKSAGLREDFRIVAEGPVLGGKGHFRVTHCGESANPVNPAKPVYGGAGGFGAALDMMSAEFDEQNPQSLLAAIKLQLDPEDVSSLMSKLHASMNDLNAMTNSIAVQMDPEGKDALIAKVGGILDNLNLITGHLRDQITPGKEEMVLAKVQQALDSINSGLSDAVTLLEENRPRISNTLMSMEHLASTVDGDIAVPIARELDASNPQGLLTQARESFEKLNHSLADINVISGKGRKLMVLNEERFNRLVVNAKEASDHLKSAAKDLRRNPWRLLYRPSPDETKQLAILDAAREFSEAAGRLDDSASQLRALAESRNEEVPADDPELVALRKELLDTFENFRQAEQSLWKQLGTP